MNNSFKAGPLPQAKLPLILQKQLGVIQLTRADSENGDFAALVKHLGADLAERAGEDHSFFAQFNKIDTIKMA